ncbi:MAG: tetratricopeptide repeat protein [Rhizomicrobium sp.]
MDLRAVFEQGVAAHRAGQLAQAENLYRQILRSDVASFPALHMLGFLKAQQGRYDEAITLLNKAIRQNPNDPTARGHYAHALMAAGRFDDALAAYDRLLAAQPDDFEALYNRGVILSQQQRFEDSLAALNAALALRPGVAAIFHNRGAVLVGLERHREAMESYDRALELDPGYIPARANRTMVALNLCDWDRVARTPAQEIAAVAPPLTFLGYSDDKALQLQCAMGATRTLVPTSLPPLWQGEKYRHDKIRLAYVSADFREHAVAFQIASLIERHDRGRFQVIGISTGPSDDSAIRARLVKGFDRFHDFAALNSDEIARRLRDMEIDIAIDLGGHTGQARPQIFAHRPAPVQAGWLGYPGTTGASFIDYLIADPIVAPFEDQPFFTEKLVHLPHTYFPTDPVRERGAAPSLAACGLPENGFVFCAFNNNWKITRPLFDVWMRLLAAMPQSVLWLKQPAPDARGNLEREAAARGIDPARLVYADNAPLEIHLARHANAGLFLDTLPYNAHATAADALGAGLPVLTCKGQAFAGRVAASLLEAVGLPELVAQDLEDYEARALDLARDPAKLKAIQQKLAQNLAAAPLFDADGFRRDIETAYSRMWEARGETPRGFRVEPSR